MPQPIDAPGGEPTHAAEYRPTVLRRQKQKAGAARQQVAFGCFLLHLAALGACAKLGAVRPLDSIVSLLLLAVSYALALSDSKRLPLFVATAFIYSPLLRRVLDWSSGGYASLTIISLLPSLLACTLAIPTLPRLKSMPKALRQPLFLILAPTLYGACLGLAINGAGAAVEAIDWLAPLLFLPYFACLPPSKESATYYRNGLYVIAATSAIYAVIQYFTLPAWDKLWLIASGMTSSMGWPSPMRFRVWGTMNAAGPAGQVWALVVVVLLLDRVKSGALKAVGVVSMMLALLLTLVRSAWLMALVGLLVVAIRSGGKRSSALVVAALGIVACFLLATLLPGGDVITKRFDTFQKLDRDDSYQARSALVDSLSDQIVENPFGLGLGFRSAGKMAGGTSKVVALDNGFGELAMVLSFPGAVVWLAGMLLLLRYAGRHASTLDAAGRRRVDASIAVLLMSLAVMVSGFSFSGLVACCTYYLFSESLAPTGVPTRPSVK